MKCKQAKDVDDPVSASNTVPARAAFADNFGKASRFDNSVESVEIVDRNNGG